MKNNILFFILLMSIISCNKEENCYDSLDNHVNNGLNGFLKKEWKLSKITVEAFNTTEVKMITRDSILPKELMPNFSFRGFNDHNLQFFLDGQLLESFLVVSNLEPPKPAAFEPINNVGTFQIESFDCSPNNLNVVGSLWNNKDSIVTWQLPYPKTITEGEIRYDYTYHYESES